MNDDVRGEREEQIPDWDRDDDGFNGLGAPFFEGDPEDAVEEAENLMAKVGLQNTELADLRQQLAEKDKQLHVMELRAKSAEAIANMAARESVRQHLQRETELSQQLAEARDRIAFLDNDDLQGMKIAQKQQQQLAAQAAELETLKRELSMTKNNLLTSFGGSEDTPPHLLAFAGGVLSMNKAAELATLRERLAAVVDAFNHYKAVEVIGYSVYIKENGRSGLSPHAELFTALAELAAGWIPPGTKGEGW